jgi:hypothetical protein
VEPLTSEEPPLADHATENDAPSLDSDDGVAPPEEELEANCALPKPDCDALGSSVTASVDQAESEMVPV